MRDIAGLDDKPFVRQRRKRNTIVTAMYFIVILAFIFVNHILANILIFILN